MESNDLNDLNSDQFNNECNNIIKNLDTLKKKLVGREDLINNGYKEVELYRNEYEERKKRKEELNMIVEENKRLREELNSMRMELMSNNAN